MSRIDRRAALALLAGLLARPAWAQGRTITDSAGRKVVVPDRIDRVFVACPPASVLLKAAAKVEKGSGVPHREKVGKVTWKQVEDIAKQKMPDLNCDSLDSAVKTIAGLRVGSDEFLPATLLHEQPIGG